MAKESKTTTVTVSMDYGGHEMTISKVCYDYELEESIKALSNQVKLLEKGDQISVTMEE